MYRRVYIAEIPLVCGQFSVGMRISFLKQQLQLIVGKLRIDEGVRDGMKRRIPGNEAGIFPFVRDRNDVRGG